MATVVTEAMDKLISRRSNFKGRLTRIYNFVDNEDNHDKIYELQVRQKELTELFNKYSTTQEDIELCDDKTEEKPRLHEQERTSTEDKYYMYQAKIAELLKEAEYNNSVTSLRSLPEPSKSNTSIIKLPSLQIQPFEGKISEWCNFKALFDGAIDNNKQLSPLFCSI